MRLALIVMTGLAAACAAVSAHAAAAHYDLRATLNLEAGTVAARTTITLPPDAVGRETIFDLGDRFTLRKVDGGPAATIRFEATDKPLPHLRKIIFDFKQPPGHPVTFRFAYDGPLSQPGEKPEPKTPGMLELGLEDGWFPFRPNLNLQFTADTDIRGVPPDMVVVAQGDVSHIGDRLRIHRATTDFDIPIVAVTGLQRVTAPGVEIYARDFNNTFVRIYRENAGPIMAYYDKLFGPLQPGPPIRLVVVPRGGGGYERRSFIRAGDANDELKKNPDFDRSLPARFIAHEFSHAWWWDADSSSENYWLAESMAEYSSMRYQQFAFGDGPYEAFLEHKREPAKAAGPIIGAGGGRPSKAALYQKGPLLLIDLEHKIGRPAMDRLLGILGRDHPHITADFLAALSGVAGPDAARDFETALRS